MTMTNEHLEARHRQIAETYANTMYVSNPRIIPKLISIAKETILSAINEATEQLQVRVGELEATNKSIADKIDGISTYDKHMSHGEHMSLAGEYDELLTEIRGSIEEIESRQENRPDSHQSVEGGEGIDTEQDRCTCPNNGAGDCDYCIKKWHEAQENRPAPPQDGSETTDEDKES